MAKTRKSALAGKVNKSAETERELPVPQGGGDLPAGIEDGVAKLIDIKIGEYESGDNKGKPYFMMRGVVIEPEKHEGQKVAGRQTILVMEPLHNTPSRARKTEDEHIDYMVDVLRNLNGEAPDGEAVDDGTLFAAMLDADLHCKFRTWKGEKDEIENRNGKFYVVRNGSVRGGPFNTEAALKNQFRYAGRDPQTNVTYLGSVDYEGGEVEVVDDSEPEDDEPQQWDKDDAADLDSLAKKADADDEDAQEKIAERAEALGIDPEDDAYETWAAVVEAIQGAEDPGEPEDEEVEEEDAEEEAPDDISLQDHGTLADDDGDEESIDFLTAKAEEAGLDPDDYGTWAELADALASGGDDGGEEDTEAADEEPDYEKGEIVYYKPPRAKAAKECEITAVFAASKKLNLKDVATGKTYKGVAYEALEE